MGRNTAWKLRSRWNLPRIAIEITLVCLCCCVAAGSGAQVQLADVKEPKDAKGPSPRNLPLPDLRAPVVLRVAYAHNSRFEALTGAQIDAALQAATQAVQAHFNLTLRFDNPVMVSLPELFAHIPPTTREKAEKARINATTYGPTRERLARSLLTDMRVDGDMRAQLRFATPYLLGPPTDGSPLAFARALIATQHSLLAAWRDLPARDGQPSLGADRFNEYSYWTALGDSPMAFDVILTNQLIASAEHEGNSVHSALRGGVSNGITTQSRLGQFQLYSVVSSFPFFDNAPPTRALRDGEASEPQEASRQMGLLLAHELGHLLLHLGHPFANRACVMRPPVRFEFRRWLDGLDAIKCPVAESRANTPGFIQFTRPEILFR